MNIDKDIKPFNSKGERHGYWKLYHTDGNLFFNSSGLISNVPAKALDKLALLNLLFFLFIGFLASCSRCSNSLLQPNI